VFLILAISVVLVCVCKRRKELQRSEARPKVVTSKKLQGENEIEFQGLENQTHDPSENDAEQGGGTVMMVPTTTNSKRPTNDDDDLDFS
jgi:hypothetical protein